MKLNILKYYKKSKTPSVEDKLLKIGLHPISYFNDQDVFIASYPKSGVTWLQHMTASLIYGLDASIVPDNLVNFLIPDTHAVDYYLRTVFPTVFKSHSLPRPHMKRVVHLVRDGRDVMVSYHAMLNSQGHNVSLEEMINNDKHVYPCSWASHCEQWLHNPYNAEILRISYEELILDTTKTLRKYSEFLNINVDENTLNRTIEKSKFANFQQKEKNQGWLPSFSMGNGVFFRRGKIGSHKDEMKREIKNIFDDKNKYIMNKLGYI